MKKETNVNKFTRYSYCSKICDRMGYKIYPIYVFQQAFWNEK